VSGGEASIRRRSRPNYVQSAMPLASRSWPCPAILGDAVPIWSRRPNARILAQTHEILWEMPPWHAPPATAVDNGKTVASFGESLLESEPSAYTVISAPRPAAVCTTGRGLPFHKQKRGAEVFLRPFPFLGCPHTRKGASGYSGRSCSTASAHRSGMASLGSAGRDRRTTHGRHSP
jgi:hypothetical protein